MCNLKTNLLSGAGAGRMNWSRVNIGPAPQHWVWAWENLH